LCDRVAVLLGGTLQGVGAPGEIVSMQAYAMEIFFEMRDGRLLASALAGHATKISERFRVEVPEEQLYSALEQLRGCEARILSVAPLRPTLEDYFLKLVARDKASPNPSEKGDAQ
jgi:ABC-type multidrug transport system ATPase subunit